METIISFSTYTTGSCGPISYSGGQVYYPYIGSLSIYNVARGIQHQETRCSGEY